MTQQIQQVGDVIDGIRGLLARFASKEYAHELADHTGVRVRYSTQQRDLVMFSFVTGDGIALDITFNFTELTAVGQAYIANMLRGVMESLNEHREKRLKTPIVIH